MVHDDPYGQVQGTALGRFGFTGELQQGGDVYLRARWYAAGSGSFGVRDPFVGWAERPLSLHPYVYVHSDPVSATDPTGWYRCVDGTPNYQQFCKDQFELLERTSLTNAQTWARTDSLRALLFMFANNDIAADMPGGSGRRALSLRQQDMNPAAERLDFVLWATQNRENGQLTNSPTHFYLEFNDTGFAEEFRDAAIWQSSGNQVGHFLTAVHIAYDSSTIPGGDVGGLVCIIGHELVSDQTFSNAYQCAAGFAYHDGRSDIDRFLDALIADVEGRFEDRDCLLRQIVGLPDDYIGDRDKTGTAAFLRHGNSMQDIRLSAKGVIFGSKIKQGTLSTLAAAHQWLMANLRPHG